MRDFANSPRRGFYRAVQGGLTTTKAITSNGRARHQDIRATQRAVRWIRNDKKFAIEFIRGPISTSARIATGTPTVFTTAALANTTCKREPSTKSSSAKMIAVLPARQTEGVAAAERVFDLASRKSRRHDEMIGKFSGPRSESVPIPSAVEGRRG